MNSEKFPTAKTERKSKSDAEATPEQNSRIENGVAAIRELNILASQKARLVLVLAGLKPATDVVLEQHDSSPEETERLLSQAGLQYARVDRKLLAEDPQIAAYYAVANDPAFARELAEILSFAEKTPAQHQRFGQLMGYPQTAINAFAANQTLDDETTLPQDIVSSPFYFKLSSAHAPEEMARIREWDDALRRYAPDLDRGKE